MDEIINGDAYELIKTVPDKSVDLIVTDPPYDIKGIHPTTGIFKYRDFTVYDELHGKGIDASMDFEAMLPELERVMKRTNIYIWCNKEQIFDYLAYFAKGRRCNFEIIIWGKTNPPPFVGSHYLKDKEYCLYFWEKGVKVHPSFETGKTVYVTEVNVSDKKKYHHPTIKPFGIISNLIENSSEAGGVVLDPFSGSGTTCAVAKSLGRHYMGFEIDKGYWEMSQRRLDGVAGVIKRGGAVMEQLSLL